MPNTNCLEGIRCPKCGNEDEFRIEGTTIFTVTDDGTESYGDVEWTEDFCECTECHFYGRLDTFRQRAKS